MTTIGLQGISSYQMQYQSLSSRVNELTKNSDNYSLSIASALRQQMHGIQSKMFEVETSNKNAWIKNYNSKAEIEADSVGNNFDIKA